PPTLSPFFFFNAPPTPHISTLSLHDALPISALPASERRLLPAHAAAAPRLRAPVPRDGARRRAWCAADRHGASPWRLGGRVSRADRKSTRLNSSHRTISYAVFCLKKKKQLIR